MSHVRSQIRAAAKSILDAAMPGHTVFKGRKYDVNTKHLPMVDMRFETERAEGRAMSNVRYRTGVLAVRVARHDATDDIDDALDDDAVSIEHALSDQVFGGLVKYCELTQTDFTEGAAGDKPVTNLVLQFTITYRTAMDAVDIARE